MPPRKRKGTKAVADEPQPDPSADGPVAVDAQTMQLFMQKLGEMELSVDRQCEAIRQAAREAIDRYKQEVQLQLVGLPKNIRETPFSEIEAALNNNTSSSSAAAAAAAAAAVEQHLQAAQDKSLQALAAAPSTRSLRSRSRTASAAPAEPAATATARTTRRTATRTKAAAAPPPVPKFAEAAAGLSHSSPAAGDAADAAGTSAAAQKQDAAPARSLRGFGGTLGLSAIPEDEVAGSPEGPSSPAAAAATAPAAAGALQERLASAAERAQARIDAKLASIGGTRTSALKSSLRAPQPGEECFSRNGSPLSVLMPNVTRTRGRTGRATAAAGPAAMPLATPAAGAGIGPDHGAMLGSFTIVHKPAAQQGRGRARRAAGAAGPSGGASKGENTDPSSTSIVITTKDGQSFPVDASAKGLDAVPQQYREEVAQQLRMLQDLAARALSTVAK